MITLEGKLVSLRTRGGDWCVGELEYQNEEGANIITPVVGVMPEALSGDKVIVGGFYKKHHIYGDQFAVQTFFRDVPDTGTGVESWLMEHLPDIGHVRAAALVEKFGPGLWEVLEEGRVQELSQIRGITEDRARAIAAAYDLHKADRAAMVEYMDLGLKASEARALFDYVRATPDVDAKYFKGNPYCLYLEAKCVHLTRAIQIGEQLGKFPHPDWHVSWVIHRVRTYMRDTGATLIGEVALQRWEQYPHGILFDKAVERAISRGWLCRYSEDTYQLPNHFRSEETIVSAVRTLIARSRSADIYEGEDGYS